MLAIFWVAAVLATALMCCLCVFQCRQVVEENHVMIVYRFGKRHRMLRAGVHIIKWPIETLYWPRWYWCDTDMVKYRNLYHRSPEIPLTSFRFDPPLVYATTKDRDEVVVDVWMTMRLDSGNPLRFMHRDSDDNPMGTLVDRVMHRVRHVVSTMTTAELFRAPLDLDVRSIGDEFGVHIEVLCIDSVDMAPGQRDPPPEFERRGPYATVTRETAAVKWVCQLALEN